MEVIKIVGWNIEAVGSDGPAGWVHLVDVDGTGIDLFCPGLGSGRSADRQDCGEHRGKNDDLLHGFDTCFLKFCDRFARFVGPRGPVARGHTLPLTTFQIPG